MARAVDPHAGQRQRWKIKWSNKKRDEDQERIVRTEHFLLPFVVQGPGNAGYRPCFRQGKTGTKYVVFYDMQESQNQQRIQGGPQDAPHKWSAASNHGSDELVARITKVGNPNVQITTDQDVSDERITIDENDNDWYRIIESFALSEVEEEHKKGGSRMERLRTKNPPVITQAPPRRRQRIGERELRGLGIEASQSGSSRVTRSRARALRRRTRQSTLGR